MIKIVYLEKMSKIDIFFLDNSNNTKEVINIIKPKTYQELLKQIGQRFKNIKNYYEIFIFDKYNKELKINNENSYKSIEDILFIREVDGSILEQSVFEKNYNLLSESKQEKLDDIYNCILCTLIIKNENPYLCYKCQKIFHEKCLNTWDKKCKSQKKNLICPNCRNELPLEEWNKKLNYEENRKDNANLINKINEYKLNDNMNKNINMIKDKKISELKVKEINSKDTIKKYKAYIEKTKKIFAEILNKINSIHSLLNLKNNFKIKNLLSLLKYSDIDDQIDNIYNLISEELDQFKNYIIMNNNNNKNIDNYLNINYNEKNNINFNNKKEINKIENFPEKKLILNENLLNKPSLNKTDNIKDNLLNILFNIMAFKESINSYDNIEDKKENFVYLVQKNFLTKYFEKYNLKYNVINEQILSNKKYENKEFTMKKKLLKEYISKEFKMISEASFQNLKEDKDLENKNELSFIIVKNNDEKIYYYNNYFLLDKKTVELLDIIPQMFPKLEYFGKEGHIFLFQSFEGRTIIELGSLDNQHIFKIEILIEISKNYQTIINIIKTKKFREFYLTSFLFHNNFSPVFDEEKEIIGYAYKINEGQNNFSNYHYNQILMKIIYLILFFKYPKYNNANVNSKNYYYLINENWIKNFKRKYMYERTKIEIEHIHNKNIQSIINKERKDKKLFNKFICLIIDEMPTLNKKYNEINNMVLEDIPFEPDVKI